MNQSQSNQLLQPRQLPLLPSAEARAESAEGLKREKDPSQKYFRAKEMVESSKLIYQSKFQSGLMTEDKFQQVMENISQTLSKLDSKIEQLLGTGSIVKYEEVNSEIESIIEPAIKDTSQVETETFSSIDISSSNAEEMTEIIKSVEYKKTLKVTSQNLAEMARRNPNQTALKIQQLTGLTLDAGELLNTEENISNKAILEYVAKEILLKNFELRIQNPGGQPFLFVILNSESLTVNQQNNYNFLKDFALTQDNPSNIHNYSALNPDNRVIAFVKEPVKIEYSQPIQVRQIRENLVASSSANVTSEVNSTKDSTTRNNYQGAGEEIRRRMNEKGFLNQSAKPPELSVNTVSSVSNTNRQVLNSNRIGVPQNTATKAEQRDGQNYVASKTEGSTTRADFRNNAQPAQVASPQYVNNYTNSAGRNTRDEIFEGNEQSKQEAQASDSSFKPMKRAEPEYYENSVTRNYERYESQNEPPEIPKTPLNNSGSKFSGQTEQKNNNSYPPTIDVKAEVVTDYTTPQQTELPIKNRDKPAIQNILPAAKEIVPNLAKSRPVETQPDIKNNIVNFKRIVNEPAKTKEPANNIVNFNRKVSPVLGKTS